MIRSIALEDLVLRHKVLIENLAHSLEELVESHNVRELHLQIKSLK